MKQLYQPKAGDILFTKDGTLGISYLVKEDKECVMSSAFLRCFLKAKYKDFEKGFLVLFFNSAPCKLQVERLSGGAVISHLKPSDFEKIKLPLFDNSIQTQIAKKIQKSFQLRKESETLYDEAETLLLEELGAAPST